MSAFMGPPIPSARASLPGNGAQRQGRLDELRSPAASLLNSARLRLAARSACARSACSAAGVVLLQSCGYGAGKAGASASARLRLAARSACQQAPNAVQVDGRVPVL